MDATTLNLTQVVFLLGLLLTGGGIALSGGVLIVAHNIVKNARSDTALITAINHLYNSVPAPVQETLQEVGQVASDVGGLVGARQQPLLHRQNRWT